MKTFVVVVRGEKQLEPRASRFSQKHILLREVGSDVGIKWYPKYKINTSSC